MIEQIVAANDWVFDRPNDQEMAVQVPGKWCDYNVFCAWNETVGAMHFTVAFDTRVPKQRRAPVHELLALINDKVWMGHFAIWQEEGLLAYRHALPLRGSSGPSLRAGRGPAAERADRLRALLSSISVCRLGRQIRRRRTCRGDDRNRGRSLIPIRMPRSIVLVGCGNMGGALLQGWLDQGDAGGGHNGRRARRCRGALAARDRAVVVVSGPTDLPSSSPDVVVLAVKPQVVDAIRPALCALRRRGRGRAVDCRRQDHRQLEPLTWARKAALVRAMPNTPAAVRRGISVACGNAAADARRRARCCEQLLAAVGVVLWVDDEALMDAVTAVSGSGPAYVFLMAECLGSRGRRGRAAGGHGATAGARDDGRLRRAARPLGAPPELLRRNVTSPGGTTAAALAVLMADDALQALLGRAVHAAARRSRELAS